MRRTFLIIALVLSPMAAVAASPATAVCGPATVGMVACLSGKLCACRAGVAPGMAPIWDCGVLRPRCGDVLDNAEVPTWDGRDGAYGWSRSTPDPIIVVPGRPRRPGHDRDDRR